MNRAAKRRKWKPEVLTDGSVRMRAGIVIHACCPGFHVLPETAKALGLQFGDYLEIEHDAGGNRVTRELVSCTRGCAGMRENYVYMDSDSAVYLETAVHDWIKVKLAEYPLDCP